MIVDTINSIFSQYQSTRDCHVKLLGVRGSGPVNSLSVYDDLIYRIVGNDFVPFQASVDPGWYWIQNPMNSDGCFQLGAGLHWFEFGLHRGHPALVQSGEFHGWRLNKDGTRKCPGLGEAVNNHSGGSGDDVGHYSAGCQVIKSDPAWGDDWLSYYNKIKYECDIAGQTKIPYVLVESLPAITINI